VGLFRRKPSHAKRATDVVRMGSVAGTMLLTMEDERLTRLFLFCARNHLAETWSSMFAVVAASYAYLESTEGSRSSGETDGRGPVLAATRDAIVSWKPELSGIFGRYLLMVKHLSNSRPGDNAERSAEFFAFQFQRQPGVGASLKQDIESREVTSIMSELLKSQFQRYWD